MTTSTRRPAIRPATRASASRARAPKETASGGFTTRPMRESSSSSFSSRCILSTASAIRAMSALSRSRLPASASFSTKPRKPRIVMSGLLRSCDTV